MRSNPQQQQQQYQPRPGQPRQQGKGGFVICEICDGYIKDLEQLKNHMSWIHKVTLKINFYLSNDKLHQGNLYTELVQYSYGPKQLAS